MKNVAIVLAAGSGSRMGGTMKKQFMPLLEKPVLFYSLKAFEESFVDGIVIVTSGEDIEYVRREIVSKYGFSKVVDVVPGGEERYNSVLCGLRAAGDADYIFIHDGARALVTVDILERAYGAVQKYDACVIGMPSKDTVKISDENGMVASTPNRNCVWTVQTPQVFRGELIKEAYEDVVSRAGELLKNGVVITDDAMVLEEYSGHPVRLVEGSYENIKLTTPEDIYIAEEILRRRKGNL